MRQITKAELLERTGADEEQLAALFVRYPDAIGVVLFSNVAFDSSRFGSTTCMVVGPSNTYKSIDECAGQHLFDLPSQRQHAVAWVPRSEFFPRG